MDQSTNFLASRAYFQDDVTWCVPHAKLRAKWKSLFYVADANILAIFFSAMLPLIVIIYFFTTFERRALDIWSSMLMVIAIASAHSFSYSFERSSARILYSLHSHLGTAVLVIFLAFATIEFSQLNYEKQISSFDQITNENFRLAANDDMRNYLVERNLVN